MLVRDVLGGLSLAAILWALPSWADGDFVIAVRGEAPSVTVVRSADAAPSVAYAAEELVAYVGKLTGVRLPVAAQAQGRTVRLVLDEAMGDAFALKADADGLVVKGGRRGVLSGVYELLETYGGVGWFASWHEVVPRLDRLCVPSGLDRSSAPAFDLRETLWHDTYDGDFAARLRLNGNAQRLTARHGGHSHRFSGQLGNCHTFGRLVPPDEFFATHPEYFSEIDGRRVREQSQLCLTNPEVLAIVTERVREAMRREPEARFFGVSQNDNRNFCTCARCKAVDDEEGSHAGTMIRFVNAVAAAVEREFPGKVIETLAYTYTRKPPRRTRPRANVMPCLCSIECDFSRPLATSPDPENVRFREDITGWASISPRLYVWDYTTNFRHYPQAFPNVLAMAENVRFYRDRHVDYLFEQGDWQGSHADFAELKAWLLAKLMWDPDQPVGPLLDRFFAGYYGKGAPFVRAYFDELHQRRRTWAGEDPSRSLHVYEELTRERLDDAFLAKADALWRQAEEAVKDEPAVYRRNVRMGRFTTAYTRFLRQARSLCVTRDAARLAEMRQGGQLAAWILARMDEAPDLRIAERSGVTEQFRARVQRVSQTVAKADASGRALATASDFMCDYGKVTDDAGAFGGKSIRLAFDHYEWSAYLNLSQVMYDPGKSYSLRVHLRADLRPDAPPDAEVFWAGVYDPVAKRDVSRTLLLKVKDCKPGWAWYDLATIPLNDDAYVWIAPGRFDKTVLKASPAHVGVWVDAVEIVSAVEQGAP